MATRNTQTQTDVNGKSATFTHLSTNIIVMVNNRPIDAISSISINESRNIKMISAVGSDGHIDSAPSASTEISGRCTRTRYNGRRMFESFGRGFLHLKSQRVPFDIVIQDIFQSTDPTSFSDTAIITTVKNVWFTSLDVEYKADDYIITETAGWKAEDIQSLVRSGNAISSTAPVYINQFEREADRGKYRGALDAPGLIFDVDQ